MQFRIGSGNPSHWGNTRTEIGSGDSHGWRAAHHSVRTVSLAKGPFSLGLLRAPWSPDGCRRAYREADPSATGILLGTLCARAGPPRLKPVLAAASSSRCL